MLCMLVHILYTFRVYVYRNCSRAINYLIIIKLDYYSKICLLSPQCIETKHKKEEEEQEEEQVIVMGER